MFGRFFCGAALAVSAAAACDMDESGRPGDDAERIVGGSDTNITELPWQISLQTNGGFHFCGGSIIDDDWILTAAHCVSGSSPNSMRVKAGVTNKNGNGQVRSVAQIFVAPGYNGDTSDGRDAALLRLSSPLDLSGNAASAITLATVAENAFFAPGTDAVVSGWGTLSSGGSSPTILQSVEVPIISNADAAAAYGAGSVTPDQIGAGIIGVGGVDSCQGDSGGPLAVASPSGPLLVGIVSWGFGCASPQYPGMYARVSSFTDWIEGISGVVGGGGGDGGGDDGGGDDGGGDDGGGDDGGGDDGGNGDSCEGRCGEFDQAESCQCDDQCVQFGDCCDDKAELCDDAPPPPPPPPPPGPNTCVGACGADAGNCWCDNQCVQFGDCCDDKVEICG